VWAWLSWVILVGIALLVGAGVWLVVQIGTPVEAADPDHA
jgi:hypothetical protein